MKKILFSVAAMAMTMAPTVVMAQEGTQPDDPKIQTGYFRIINNGYGDVVTVDRKYGLSINATEGSARTQPGSIFYYDTNGIYNFADDMEQIKDEEGNVSLADLMRLMATTSWKSGSYGTYDLSCQGISLGKGYLENLMKYVNAAADNFDQSEAVKNFYETGPRWYLFVAMSGLFYPADMETLETFQAAVKRFMQQWKRYFDFGLYMNPVQDMDNCFTIHFHSPLDIAKMQDTQDQINNMTDESTGQNLGYNYNFFAAFKQCVIDEAAKELDGDALAYVKHVLEPIDLNREYYIGENEQGEIYSLGFTTEAMFGENGEWEGVSQDELIWTIQPVDETNPLLVPMKDGLKDTEGNYYTTMFTDFAYQLGEGVEALYISAIEDGQATLTPFVGKVPANTAVILRSKNAAAVSNVLLPIDEELPAIEGNLLKGTCLPMQDSEGKYVLTGSYNSQIGNICMGTEGNGIAANSCYTEQPAVIAALDLSGIHEVVSRQTGKTKCFDLQGREAKTVKKGIYVVNGKKVVK